MATTNSNATINVAPIVEEIISCGVTSIQVYSTGDANLRYRVAFDTMFDGVKKVDEEYVISRIDHIDFVPRVLIAQCINKVDGMDLMYTKKKEAGLRNDNAAGFGAAELQVILRGAKLKIKRTKFEIGSEYTNAAGEIATHENAGYNTDIVDIKVTDKIQAKLDAMIDSVFDI